MSMLRSPTKVQTNFSFHCTFTFKLHKIYSNFLFLFITYSAEEEYAVKLEALPQYFNFSCICGLLPLYLKLHSTEMFKKLFSFALSTRENLNRQLQKH